MHFSAALKQPLFSWISPHLLPYGNWLYIKVVIGFRCKVDVDCIWHCSILSRWEVGSELRARHDRKPTGT